jgi:site-specific DNA recombinase
MRHFYGYIRVSTARQGETGVSLDQQRAAIEAYAERNDFDLVRWFEEQETAAKRGRPIFGQMLKLLKSGRAAGVIIHKIDRSARNLRDWADLGELIDQGIAVHFANESLDLNSRGGRLAADIQAIISADFIRNLREETKKGFYGRLKQGLFPRPAPVGYLNCGKGVPKAVDANKAHYIRTAFELYATGRFGLKELTKEMYEQGLRGRNERRISLNGMSKILNNRFYTGIIEVKTVNETYSGIHEPIITQALFDRVQATLHDKTNRKVIKHQMLFRRMFRCQHCNFHLIGETHRGIVYYRCHTTGCPSCPIRESKLEQAVIRELKRLEYTQEEKDHIRGRLLQLRKDWSTQQLHTTQSLQLQLKQLDERLNKLTDAYLDQMIDKESFELRKTTLLEERRSTRDRLAESARNPLMITDRLQHFLERAGNAYLTYKMATIDEKRELIDTLTSNRVVAGKSPKIMLDSPFNMVANRFNVPGGSPPRSTPRIWNALIYRILTMLKRSDKPTLLEEHAM